MTMTDKHIIDKENGEVRKVEDIRVDEVSREAWRKRDTRVLEQARAVEDAHPYEPSGQSQAIFALAAHEARKVEDARMYERVGPHNAHLPLDAYVQLALSSPDNAPVIETSRVVRSRFGAWRLDWEGTTVTVEHENSVSEFEATIEDLADLARLLPAFLAKVVE